MPGSITVESYTLGGFGCSAATSVEVAQLSRRPAASVNSITKPAAAPSTNAGQIRRPQGVYFPTRLDECYPAKLARAKLIDNYLAVSLSSFGAQLVA